MTTRLEMITALRSANIHVDAKWSTKQIEKKFNALPKPVLDEYKAKGQSKKARAFDLLSLNSNLTNSELAAILDTSVGSAATYRVYFRRATGALQHCKG